MSRDATGRRPRRPSAGEYRGASWATGNTIVKDVHDAAKALVGPFDGMFTIGHHHRTQVAVNWGIAAVVWFMASRAIARLLHRY